MINEFTFIGNLTKQPELRIIKKKNGEETFVTTLTIAVDRRKANIPLDGTDFFDVTVWGKSAENCCIYLTKGSKVHIKGYITINSSEVNGQRRFYTQFTGQRVIFLSKPAKQGNKDLYNPPPNIPEPPNLPTPPAFEMIDDNDIPF